MSQTFVLQVGHYPRTKGATGAPGEQAYAHEVVVAEAERILRAQGHTVHVMGADDTYYPAGDVFVAVHYDGSTNPRARGASVGYRDAAGQAVAHRWKVAYQRYGFDGGYRPDNYTTGLARYYGTGRSRCKASFILEGGFGSHPVEGPWLRSREGIATCARAIADALTGGKAVPPPDEEDDVLKRGDDGNEVRVMQWRINQLLHGEADPRGSGKDHGLVVDGQFGPNTEAYVKEVQKRFGYHTSGLYNLPTALRIQERLIQAGIIQPKDAA